MSSSSISPLHLPVQLHRNQFFFVLLPPRSNAAAVSAPILSLENKKETIPSTAISRRPRTAGETEEAEEDEEANGDGLVAAKRSGTSARGRRLLRARDEKRMREYDRIHNYPSWAKSEMMSGTPMKAADKRLKGPAEEVELQRAMCTGFWCIQEEASARPSMEEVVKMLEGLVETNTPPIPQIILELMEEGLYSVYKAMRGDWFTIDTSLRSSRATCSYSTMSPK